MLVLAMEFSRVARKSARTEKPCCRLAARGRTPGTVPASREFAAGLMADGSFPQNGIVIARRTSQSSLGPVKGLERPRDHRRSGDLGPAGTEMRSAPSSQ